MQHYDNPAWQPWLIVAAIGVIVILVGIACQVAQLAVSIRDRQLLRDLTGDPWNGRTLEWSTSSPPPPWNFAVLPQVGDVDAWWSRKQAMRAKQEVPTRSYQAIEMPKNTPIGFITAFFAVVTGFALIWHIWWMVGLGIAGTFLTMLSFAFRREEEIEISADEIARFDRVNEMEPAQ